MKVVAMVISMLASEVSSAAGVTFAVKLVSGAAPPSEMPRIIDTSELMLLHVPSVAVVV